MEREKGELFKSFAYDYSAEERESTEKETERRKAEEERALKRKEAEERVRQMMDRRKAAEEEEPGYVPKFEAPEGMVIPKSQRHANIVEKTAVFLSKGDKQLEIVLRTKQGNNPLFEFLTPTNALHPYYRHLKFLISSGLYTYSLSEGDQSAGKKKKRVIKKVKVIKPIVE